MPKAILYSGYFKSISKSGFGSVKHVTNYMEYINKQSPVFGLDGDTGIQTAVQLAQLHAGSQFWRQVYSLRAGDCERLAVDREYFKALLSAKRTEIAKAYNIRPENLNVVASFHNKAYHPHLHMVFYSTNSREGHLHVHKNAEKAKVLNRATRTLKSILTNEIFREDLHELKVCKGEQRTRINEQFQKEIDRIAQPGYAVNKDLVNRLRTLGDELAKVSGKKTYGYLPPTLKEKVDDVVRQIFAQDKTAAALFAQYGQQQQMLVKSYVDSAETLANKMQDWEQSFFSPGKGQDTKRHNMVVHAALEAAKAEKPMYRDKTPELTTKNMLWGVCNALSTTLRQAEAQNRTAAATNRQGGRLQRKPFGQNRDTQENER